MQEYYLYKITNLLNNKSYIGITADPERRMKQHFFKRKHSTISILKLAIDKYGTENFSFEILCIGSKDYILELEIMAIKSYNTILYGYNIKEGGQCGAGYSITKTKRDKEYYVSGFWFPNIRTALKSLDMEKSTFQRRRKLGTLGDTTHKNLKLDWSKMPIYVGGFWWESIHQASFSLRVSTAALMARIKRGTVDQEFKLKKQSGSANHMFNISPDQHPSSKQVMVEWVKFNSLKDAINSTGYSKYIINKKIKDEAPGFYYL